MRHIGLVALVLLAVSANAQAVLCPEQDCPAGPVPGIPAPQATFTDPYPAFVQAWVAWVNATDTTRTWSYGGWQTAPNGWADYFVTVSTCSACQYVIVHVPAPGVPADVVFVGDSITMLMEYNTLRPDLATVNAGMGGDTCPAEVARVPTILALNPRAVVLACGNSDVWHNTNMAPTQAAILNMIGQVQNAHVPIVVATLTPALSVTPVETADPAVVAQRIRSLNTWIQTQAHALGVPVWNRWANIAANRGLYGIPGCYWPDGVHPYFCQQQILAGLAWALNGN